MPYYGTRSWHDTEYVSTRNYGGGSKAAVITHSTTGWVVQVFKTPECNVVGLLMSATVDVIGEPGRELARKFCDVTLGHEPTKVYRVSTFDAPSSLRLPAFVHARNGKQALRQLVQRFKIDVETVIHIRLRVLRAQPVMIRVYYAVGEGP